MSSNFKDLNGYCGIEGLFLYNIQKKSAEINELPPNFDEKKIKQFISTFLIKKQAIMEIEANLVSWMTESELVLIFPLKDYILLCIAPSSCDIDVVEEKVKEITMRMTLGI
jgi:hypothetical protein